MILPRNVMRRCQRDGSMALHIASPEHANQRGVPRETPFPMRRNTPETDGRLDGCQNKYRDGHHAIDPRPDLRFFLLPEPRCPAGTGGRAMIELISALLALCSIGVFAAHALDAYRSTHF
jgi:hypothetical protein